MTNEERHKFLMGKPVYACIPRNNFHTVGCTCKEWTKEELQEALDRTKRSQELQLHLINSGEKSDYCKH